MNTLSSASYSTFVNSISTLPVLSAEEEIELFKAYHENNDISAKYKIITRSFRYIRFLCREYSSSIIPEEDLFQEGVVGLLKGIDNYNPNNGVRFVTYIKYYIKQSILEYKFNNLKIYRICKSKALKKLHYNLPKYQRTGQSYTAKELGTISEELKVSVDDIKEAERLFFETPISLNIMAEEGDYTFDIEDRSSDIVEKLIKEDTDRMLTQSFNQLNDREKRIVENRTMIDIPKKLEELGKEDGCSPQRIEQIEKRAYLKMRTYIGEHYECNN